MKKTNNIKITYIILTVLIVIVSVSSCTASTDAMTYKDYVITEPEYSYWFSTIKTSLLNSYNSGLDSSEFWETKTNDGLTYKEILTDSVNTQIASILVSCQLFDEYKLSLPEDTIKTIEDDIAEKIEYIGSEEEMNEDLSKFNITSETLKEVYIQSSKVSLVRDYLYGENGSQTPTEEEIENYFKDNYRACKMIVIYTNEEIVKDEDDNYIYDNQGNLQTTPLTEEEKQLKKELIDTIVKAIDNGTDFDTCMKEFSDVDYSDYPNGFFITKYDTNDYGTEVVNKLWSMDIGKTETVSNEEMTFIIQRVELPEYSSLTDTELATISTMDANLVNQKINEFLQSKIKDVKQNDKIISKYDITTAHKNSYY